MRAERAHLAAIVEALRNGEVVGVPTDTVYGVGVLAADAQGAARIFALKGRPEAVALPVLVADLDTALGLVPPGLTSLQRLGERLWPGALTIVVPRREGLDWQLGGDGRTIGLRCPDHDLLRELLSLSGPLAVSSANRHGSAPATTTDEVRRQLGGELRCLDGGRCARPPSTVIELADGTLRPIRAGAVSFESVEAALGGPSGSTHPDAVA